MEQMKKFGNYRCWANCSKYGENTGRYGRCGCSMPLLQEILTERRNLPKNGDLKRRMAHTKNW